MSDNTARVILIIGSLVMAPIGAYHRIRAYTGEPIDRRQEGWWILLTLRPLAVVMMIALIAYLVRPSSMAWSSLPLPGWVRWLGVPVACMAAVLLLWTLRTLGPNLTDTVVTRSNAHLVTGGPYRWIRHPFYVAFLLAIVANAMVAANWFIGLAGIAVVALLAVRSRTEEQNLAARFGQVYEDYKARTGAFFPKLRR